MKVGRCGLVYGTTFANCGPMREGRVMRPKPDRIGEGEYGVYLESRVLAMSLVERDRHRRHSQRMAVKWGWDWRIAFPEPGNAEAMRSEWEEGTYVKTTRHN